MIKTTYIDTNTYDTLAEKAIAENKYAKLNDELLLPHLPSDIALFKFVDYMDGASEKEKAIVAVASSIEMVHRALHLDVKIMKEELSDYLAQYVQRCYKSLNILGLGDILTDDLPFEIIEKYLK